MKTCSVCKEEKSLDEYAWKSKPKQTKQTCCKACRNKIDAQRYKSDPDRRKQIAAKRTKRVDRNQLWMVKYLDDKQCVDCGYSNSIALEFDHVSGGKTRGVAETVLGGYSIKRIEEEISKCEIVCANCHRVRTATRGNHYRVSMAEW